MLGSSILELLNPWRWRQYVPSKLGGRQTLYSAKPPKTRILNFSYVETSNIADLSFLRIVSGWKKTFNIKWLINLFFVVFVSFNMSVILAVHRKGLYKILNITHMLYVIYYSTQKRVVQNTEHHISVICHILFYT